MQIDSNPYLAAVMRAVRSGRPMLPEDQPNGYKKQRN